MKHIARRKLKALKTNVIAWLYLLPFMCVYILFMIYPLIKGIDFSLYKKNFFSGYKFVGLGNYKFILTDPTFIQDLHNIFYFTIATVVVFTFLSLIIAVLFSRKGIVTYIMRSFVVAPLVLSVSVIGIIWQLLFTSGPGHGLTLKIFGQGHTLMNDPNLAMWIIIIATLWWTLGGDIIIFLAALRQIPAEYYEAAKLDGASWRKTFFYITMPLLRPIIVVVVILQTIASFQLFGQPYTITGGGPFNSTATPLMYIYGYLTTNVGIASAASVFLFILMLIVSLVEIFLVSREENE